MVAGLSRIYLGIDLVSKSILKNQFGVSKLDFRPVILEILGNKSFSEPVILEILGNEPV